MLEEEYREIKRTLNDIETRLRVSNDFSVAINNCFQTPAVFQKRVLVADISDAELNRGEFVSLLEFENMKKRYLILLDAYIALARLQDRSLYKR